MERNVVLSSTQIIWFSDRTVEQLRREIKEPSVAVVHQ